MEPIEKLAIKSSSSMFEFCKDTAKKIANFYTEETYPLNKLDAQPFLEVIAEEVENLFQLEEDIEEIK